MKAGLWVSVAVLGVMAALCVGGCKSKGGKPMLDRPVGARAVTAPEPPPPSYAATPAEVAPAPAVSAPASEDRYTGMLPTTHTVKKGDTLWSIAKYYYGDGKVWQRVAEANGVQGTGIKVGMKLTIP